MVRYSRIFLLLSAAFFLYADAQAFRDQVFNKTFRDDIQTVLLHPRGFPTRTPLLYLGSPGMLEFSFDQLGDDRRYYNYTVILCDYNWVPTDLSAFDYIDGFTEEVYSTISIPAVPSSPTFITACRSPIPICASPSPAIMPW